MKKLTLFLIACIATVTMYAQGIAVQGIARDTDNAAISNQKKSFVFSIQNKDNTTIYQESINIRTDQFGVFSHIVGGGTSGATINKGVFLDIDFSQELKIAVTVDAIEIYKKEFFYAPYSHFARNGAPTGSIIAFMGSTAPEGWLLCDGSSIPSKPKYSKLRNIIGNKTPNLKGRFLRGAGQGDNNSMQQVALGNKQDDSYKKHYHSVPGTYTNDDGEHTTPIYPSDLFASNTDEDFVFEIDPASNLENNVTEANAGNSYKKQYNFFRTLKTFSDFSNPVKNLIRSRSKTGSNHKHRIEARNTKFSGGSETRPYNYGVNYIIKY